MSSPTQIWRYRTLIANFTRRDLRAKYRKSILGQLWSLLNPAATLAIYTVVFGVVFQTQAPVAGNGTTKNFALYLFSALIVWNLFSAGVSASVDGLQGAGPLLNKIYFPPEGPVIAVMAGVLVQFGFELVILVVIMALVGNLAWTFLALPLVLVPLVLFTLGLGLVASVLNIFYRDVRYLIGIFLQLLFYSTPIVYTLDLVPETLHGIPVRSIVAHSPLTGAVTHMRDLFYLHRMPPAGEVVYQFVLGVVTFALGWWYFARRAAQAVEEL